MRAPALLSLLFSLFLVTSVAAKPVSENELRRHIDILASDAFEGREPGTEGERKTIAYLQSAWAEAGLTPGAQDGGWLHPVGLVRRGPQSAEAQFFAAGSRLRIASDEILLVGTEPLFEANRLPVVFVGHGVDAKGEVVADVAGKLALLLADEAAFLPGDMQSLRARRTALAKAGAAAVIAISGEQPDYAIFRRLLMSRPITLASRERRAPLEGVVSMRYMVALVTAAGADWDKLRASARAPEFAGAPLATTANLTVRSNVERFDSYNFIGKIAGRKPGTGAVVFMGHWDHLGICRPADSIDRICNGAVDNASGIAVLTEVARRLAKKRHDRDIYFIATTAEESGLLGAYAFAEAPVVPLDQIVIALNVDTIAVAPRGSRIAIIGRRKTGLDSAIESVARRLKRKVDPSNDANAYIQRQDGWALTQKDVPAFMVGSAFGDLGKIEAFLKSDYHGPEDEVNASLELGGAAEDADLHVALGEFFASIRKYAVDRVEKKTGG